MEQDLLYFLDLLPPYTERSFGIPTESNYIHSGQDMIGGVSDFTDGDIFPTYQPLGRKFNCIAEDVVALTRRQICNFRQRKVI